MIELLSALAIFTIMALALYIVFDRAQQVWRHGEYKSEQYQNARNVLDMMSRELTSAIIATGGPDSFSNIYGPAYLWSDDNTPNIGGQPFDRDQIYFIFARGNALYEVGYYINDQGNTTAADDILVRAYTSDTSTDFDISSTGTGGAGSGEFGSYDDLGFKVTDLNLNFIYKSGGTYQSTNVWDTRSLNSGTSTTDATTDDDVKLPDFIEISIRVVDQETLEREGESPPQSERKEFKVTIPMNQRSFRGE